MSMTESEATREMTFDEEYEILQAEKNELFSKENDNEEPPFANCVVRRALRCIRKLKEEREQYKAIGTVEELKSMKENGAFSALEMAQIIAKMNKLKEFEAIGTVSEFRELKEKAIKKVEKCKDKYYCECGCPVEIMLDGITLKPIGGQVYCDQCGAKLDWSEFVEKGE